MLVRCLHCHEPIELPSDSDLRNVTCAACGGSFSLVGDDTLSGSSGPTKRLGPFELIGPVGGGMVAEAAVAVHASASDRTSRLPTASA